MTGTATAGSVAKRMTIFALGVVALDAGTKAAALYVGSHHYGLGIILPLRNPDFSLGVASAAFPIMLAVSTLGILVFGGYAARAAARSSLPAWIPGLLIGGGVGNLVDRLFFGAVHDWFDLGKVVVNLADVAIFVGLFGYFAALARLGRQS
jgi:lipoprotein signal peptidase